MVSFFEAIENGYKNMFVTNKCATRAEYWWWNLYYVLLILCINSFFNYGLQRLFLVALVITHFIPTLTLSIRRLHDSDHSGWHLLWSFIPYVGIFFLLYFMLLPSNPFSDWLEEESEDYNENITE